MAKKSNGVTSYSISLYGTFKLVACSHDTRSLKDKFLQRMCRVQILLLLTTGNHKTSTGRDRIFQLNRKSKTMIGDCGSNFGKSGFGLWPEKSRV